MTRPVLPPPACVDGLRLRRVMGKGIWQVPSRYYTGWLMDNTDFTARIIVTSGVHEDIDPREWLHASISRTDRMPDYDDLAQLHRAVYGEAWAYQVFAPPASHVNIHPNCLHLWGLADGQAVLPDFGKLGTI